MRRLGRAGVDGQAVMVVIFYACGSDNDEDPYVTLKDDDDDSEAQDFTLKASDLIILAARNEDDVSNLEVPSGISPCLTPPAP
jgi:hypothetical protein